MALLTDQRVGRTEELGSFEQFLAEVDRGDFVAVELIGEPGIGKSRLLREFAGRADTQGRLVLAGSGSELERELPFAVFVDALDEYLRGLDASRLQQLDEDVLTELAQVFPSLSGLATAPVLALQHERYRVHRAGGRSSSSSRRRGRSCSCSTTFTGRIRRRSSWSVHSCTGRRPRPCS
jgi:hypothetical protein